MNFIFDMDGTICFKGQPISKNILDCLLELQEAGHFIGFASARSKPALNWSRLFAWATI